MTAGARTPEELETLLEDASISGDTPALHGLFEADRFYVPAVGQVVQARDTALTLGRQVNGSRRGADGAWRYIICVLQLDPRPGGTP